jgi:hypothetical protein
LIENQNYKRVDTKDLKSLKNFAVIFVCSIAYYF